MGRRARVSVTRLKSLSRPLRAMISPVVIIAAVTQTHYVLWAMVIIIWTYLLRVVTIFSIRDEIGSSARTLFDD